MSSGIAIWNPGIFLARYPEFTAAYYANPSKFESYFLEAGIYLSNTPTSIVRNVNTRLLLLNMLVAHISFLAGDLNSVGFAPAPPTTVLSVTAPNSGDFAVPHGLGVIPSSMQILMTSAGLFWAQNPPYDDTNIYLGASEVDVTATITLFQNSQIQTVGGEARPVGRVNSATEGSVTASFDFMPATPGSGPWFNQTQYGASFWQASSRYRGFRYIAGRTIY